ncbi:MAG: hypothetical protein AAGK21_02380 [Bacteroidota bacterium]
MHLLRQPTLRRFVAALLAVAAGATVVPTAQADARTTAVRSVLDDDEAFESALAAARSSDDPIAAFAEAYSEAVDEAVSAEAIARLIGAASFSGVAPVTVEDTRIRVLATGSGSSSPLASVVGAAASPPPSGGLVSTQDECASWRTPDAGPSAQPRGP